MHNRRARPTLRVLREDLSTDWGSPQPRRALDEDRLLDLHPLSELPHPIISKACACFGDDPASANYVGPILCSTRVHLLEIKQAQWRGGVWQDPGSEVNWLVVAGLAKGDHEDFDDFYKRIERENASGDPERWLPTVQDVRLLKQETASRIRTEWELDIQRRVLEVLRQVHAGGSNRSEFLHPVIGRGLLAHVDIDVAPVREDGYSADEVLVEVHPAHNANRDLLWTMVQRILISIEPPEQGWDRFNQTYTNIGVPGAWSLRVESLTPLVDANELATSEPGKTAHYVHRKHLAGSTIQGTAVRALCGPYFVPRQDHASLPPCADCQARLDQLPP